MLPISEHDRSREANRFRTTNPTSFMEEKFGGRKSLGMKPHDALILYASDRGISPNVAFGVYNYARHWNLDRKDHLGATVQFMDDLYTLTGKPDFFKSRSFNYISEDEMTRAYQQALGNADFMIKQVGMGLFTREDESARSIVYRAPINGTDFILSCKGGAGAGTFSLDFAIGVDKGRAATNTSGELWRTGIDTEGTEDEKGKAVRIIRTGSAVKFDPGKTEKFAEFKKVFKITPPRALAFLTLYLAHSLGAEKVKALSTTGAINLSSLRRSKNPYDYSQLFESVGFEPGAENWHTIPNFQDSFYSTIETKPDNPNGLRSYETTGMHEVLEAFQNLRGSDGKPFPIKMGFDEGMPATERVLAVFKTIHGWR
ncbi:MAG TPA: hypothetical protein VM077_05720 [Candidatus Limnocylindrales bacterium]|nr:hypothetical protein [Candidatus Limnocylindrales bacterium]